MVFSEQFLKEELTTEVYSEPFKIPTDDNVIKITAYCALDNAWMDFQFALVQDNETVCHVDGMDISYYHGYEGGESWSEGSRKSSAYFKVPKAGNYRLLTHAVSARGNAMTARKAEHDVKITVEEGTYDPKNLYISGGFSLLVLILALAYYGRWKSGEDSWDFLDD